jgi:glycosyltransferase involved in cell wall biosynthesis
VRVLFLTRYPEAGASSRYRVYQYLPYLRSHGVDYVVSPFMSKRLYALAFQPGRHLAKGMSSLAAILGRLGWLLQARRFDLVYLQRECLPFGPPVLERAFRRMGLRTVFDYDDALFIFKSSERNPLVSKLRRPEKVLEIFQTVDCVLAGNDYLRDQAAQYCKDARTFLVAEDTCRVTKRPSHRQTERPVLGWLGSTSTEKYLHLIAPALREVARRYPGMILRVVGGGRFHCDAVTVEHHEWSLESEVSLLHNFDIGLMPLPLEEWSRGKSGGKARTYMAAGLPAVCTRIGFNGQLIQDGKTGFLVETMEEWTSALVRLIENMELRQRIGDAARREVEERYSLERLGPEFVKILREVATRGRAA